MSKDILGNNALTGYNELFNSTANNESEQNNTLNTQEERVVEIPLSELYPPEFHPFHVNDDNAMESLSQNIKQYGVRHPGLVRPRPEGGYELLAGNRRKRACELAGLDTMPVIIRTMSDDEATIAMVDSNLAHRETLLFSEKAWAYKVKMDALNHSGIKGDKHSHEIITEQTGESKNQIFRLVRLTELVVGLLDKIDNKQLAFNPGVELSYLSQAEQLAVISSMETHGVKPSHSQSLELKKLKLDGKLTIDIIDKVLSATKKPQKGEDIQDVAPFRKFFPNSYTSKQITKVISGLLEKWQREQPTTATT